MATATEALRSSRTHEDLPARVRAIVGYRELFVNLVRKELKVRYKNSVLGFMWSLVNPAVTIAVFYVIFSVVLKNAIPKFVLFLMSGVLVFNLFQNASLSAVGSIVANAPLVKKVWFPREILPLAAVGATFIDFLLQSIVLVIAFAAMQWRIGWGYLPLLPIALVIGIVFTTACAVWLSAVNVKYRDMQHLLGIALMVWFWATPIIYPYQQLSRISFLLKHHLTWLPLLNPYAIVCLSFQRVLYNRTDVRTGTDATGHATLTPMLPHHGELWYLALLAVVGTASVLLLLGAAHVFSRMEGDFAEDL